MKVGIIGPVKRLEKIILLMQTEFPQMEPVICNYNIYTEAPTIVKYQQSHLDALLFGGMSPYTAAKAAITPIIPWEYIKRNSSALLRIMLRAALLYQCNIRHASFDSYSEATLYEVYDEIGLVKEHLQIFAADTDLTRADYLAYVCAFHEEKFKKQQVSCCFTALESVSITLQEKDIPCFMIEPTSAIVRETLDRLQLNYQLQMSQQSQIVALYIQMDDFNEYSLFNEDEYESVIDRMKLSKEIYLFAQKIQAAVVEIGLKEYLLFSTRQMLELETNQLENITLLHSVKKNAASTISLGIGFGQTAKEAKYGATLGMRKASQLGGNRAYIYNDKKIIGPLREEISARNASPKIDEKFLHISDQTGISINTLFRLHSLIEQYGKNTFTPTDLADLFGVTLRTVNRIIEKLEYSGYCAIVGKKSLSGTGRPRRIVQINLDYQPKLSPQPDK